MKRLHGTIKRAMDVVCSGAGLMVLAPLMGVTAAAVRVKLGAPVLYTPRRPGRHERLFTLYKFRTMMDARDESGELLPDAERLTSLGRWMRRLSIDELPQLYNVLRGDMSLVGPRPLATQYLPFYRPRERKRFDVRPGITGLAQVRGRNALSWDDKLRLDVEYVENQSLWLDVVILAETVLVVLTRRGAIEDVRSIMADLDVERAPEIERSAHVG